MLLPLCKNQYETLNQPTILATLFPSTSPSLACQLTQDFLVPNLCILKFTDQVNLAVLSNKSTDAQVSLKA